MTPADTPLFRFHRLLVGALEARDPDAPARPFTVAEIYQDLVPYRRHRDELGVDMNGDYEHVLLRLLAGEGELVRLESEPALRAIRKELERSNPNTGIYREYAAADVRLATHEVQAGSGPTLPEPDASGGAAEPSRPGVGAAPVPSPGADGEACPWCRGELPDRPNLRYCPHCGADVRVIPCPNCQEPLEPGWKFCISCGQEVEAE